MRLEFAQRPFDIVLLLVVDVVGLFREQFGNPFVLSHFHRADRQGSEKTVPGKVVERFVMQIISIEKLLKAV